MENNEKLIKESNIQEIANKGEEIYEGLKEEYEAKHTENFLAIEVESEKVYLGDSAAEAVENARSIHRDKVFYVVKIGYSASEILAGLEVKV